MISSNSARPDGGGNDERRYARIPGREILIAKKEHRRELELLRNALNLAVKEWEWLETNPFTRVKIEKARSKVERWLTPEEEKAVLENCEPWLAQIVIFTLNTGMRRGEVLSLKWPQIDLSRRTLTLLETKNGERRTLPLNQNACEILKARSEVSSGTEYLFESKNGTRIDPRNLLKELCKARIKAGIANVRFHDLRHTFATRLVQKGIGIYDVKELLGHKSLTMTMRYAHHSPDALRPAVKVLEGIGYVLGRIDSCRGLASPASI